MSALDGTDNAIASGVTESDASCRCFTLAEIQLATNNFDAEFVIGVGGFGKVYKGFITHGDGPIVVAIKRLNSESKQGANEFSAEIKMLSNLRHANLVALIGYCSDSEEKILVYEYIARGTLADHLYKRHQGENSDYSSHLSWVQRLKICVDAARGLDYIHRGTNRTFIHRDVKTTNILLDENWVVKISDFGLSKGTASHSVTHLTTNVKGTFGYLDPDYFLTQRLTTKSDVYSFGVVLLEILCGRPPVDIRREEEQIGLVNWAQQCIKKRKLDRVIDPSLSGQISSSSLNLFVKVTNNCLQKGPKARPTMAEVVESLELALASQRKVRTEGIITKLFQGIPLVPKGIDQYWSRKVPHNPKNAGSNAGKSSMERPEKKKYGTENTEDLKLKFFDEERRVFDLEDLLRASAEVMGKGKFGSTYRANLESGLAVVVKRLKLMNALSKKEFIQQMQLLGNLRHENLVEIISFYSSKDENWVIYEFVPGGNLFELLHENKGVGRVPLNWNGRLSIIKEIAKGLAFLHHSLPHQEVPHGNLKSSNVLIHRDNGLNYHSKLTGFGFLPIFPPEKSSEERSVGKSPEFSQGNTKLTYKADLYSFGIVLLEIITGKIPDEISRGNEGTFDDLLDWVRLVVKNKWSMSILDVDIVSEREEHDVMFRLMEMALECTDVVPERRPKMSEVARRIEEMEQVNRRGGRQSEKLRDKLMRPSIRRSQKIFLWKVASEDLPIRSEECPFCGGEPESAVHLFFLCKPVKMIWFAKWGIRTDDFSNLSISDWINSILTPSFIFGDSPLNETDFLHFSVILMEKTWLWRNKVLSDHVEVDPNVIYEETCSSFMIMTSIRE